MLLSTYKCMQTGIICSVGMLLSFCLLQGNTHGRLIECNVSQNSCLTLDVAIIANSRIPFETNSLYPNFGIITS